MQTFHLWIMAAVAAAGIFLTFGSLKAGGAPSSQSPFSPNGPYHGFGYPWEHNQLGITDAVPAPWTPIQYASDHVAVWGRQYRLGNGVLPRQVTTQGKEIFAGPPTLILKINGQSVVLNSLKIETRQENLATFASRQETENCRISAKVSLEYDGLWKVDLKIVPHSPTRIDQLAIVLPFQSALAEGYSRYLDYDYLEEVVNRDDTARSYGLLNAPVTLPFNPAIWIGNRHGGLEWVCETDMGWSAADPKKAIDIHPQQGATVMTVNVVSKPLPITDPYAFTFALYPTPIKPLPKDWRLKRVISESYLTGRFDTKKLDIYGITWSATIPLKYPGLPVVEASDSPMLNDPSLPPNQRIADPAERLRKLREKMKKLGIKFIPYGALNFMPARMPEGEWKDYAPYWRTHLGNKGGGTNRVWGRAQGIPDGQLTILHISPAPRSFRDFIVWQYVRAIEKYHIDGLYFDAGAPNVMAVNPNIPYGKYVAKGGKYYPFFAERKLMQRLWVACKSLNPNFFITGHNPKMPAIIAGYFDLSLTGEALTASFRSKDWTIERSMKNPAAYNPDYSIFPESLFSLGYAHQAFGSINMMLPMIIKHNGPLMRKNPARLEAYTRTMLARTLIYNIPLYGARMDLKLFSEVGRAYSHFHWLGDAEFFAPEDSSRFLMTPPKQLRVGLYLDAKHHAVLMVISNLSKTAARETIALNLDQLKKQGVILKQTPQFFNPYDMTAMDVQPGNGAAQIEIPGNDYQMFIVR